MTKKHEPFSDDDVKNFGPAILLERITVMGEAFLNPNGSPAAATYLSTTREQDCLHVVYFPRIQAVRLRLDVDKYASKYGKHIKHRDVWVPFARCKWGNTADEKFGE